LNKIFILLILNEYFSCLLLWTVRIHFFFLVWLIAPIRIINAFIKANYCAFFLRFHLFYTSIPEMFVLAASSTNMNYNHQQSYQLIRTQHPPYFTTINYCYYSFFQQIFPRWLIRSIKNISFIFTSIHHDIFLIFWGPFDFWYNSFTFFCIGGLAIAYRTSK